jgi:hypothetical protein
VSGLESLFVLLEVLHLLYYTVHVKNMNDGLLVVVKYSLVYCINTYICDILYNTKMHYNWYLVVIKIFSLVYYICGHCAV